MLRSYVHASNQMKSAGSVYVLFYGFGNSSNRLQLTIFHFGFVSSGGGREPRKGGPGTQATGSEKIYVRNESS